MNHDLVKKLEAILFLYGEPLKFSKLAGFLGVEILELKNLLGEFKGELKNEKRGLALIETEETVALATKPEFGSLVAEILKDEMRPELSATMLEVLALLTYLGPLSKSEIEFIRGVNSTFVLRNLSLRGLVEKGGGTSATLSASNFSVTAETLAFLGKSDLKDLPKYEEYRDLINNWRANFSKTHSTGSGQAIKDEPGS